MSLYNTQIQPNDLSQNLIATKMLDFKHPDVQSLIERKKWKLLSKQNAILAIYNYVRDNIMFGYNLDDTLSASRVLSDGYGQCNTRVPC